MQADKPVLDCRQLAQLVPLNSLSVDNFNDLLQRLRPETLTAGRALFRQGERDKFAFYLLDGEIELRDGGNRVSAVQAGSVAARHALAQQQPRTVSAVARTDIVYVRVDTDLLDILLTWDQSAGYVVTDIEDDPVGADADWMTRMLASKIFYQVPPANIQEIFRRMEAVPVTAGEVIIRQGEPGDYYFVLRQGEAEVTRRAPNGSSVRLARLNQGASFGEEALLAESERNATVAMLTDGLLMRLSKTDFDALLKAPLLQEVEVADALQLIKSGACWLDVRLESEHQHDAFPGSRNIPLYLLRLRLRELDPAQTYVLYCDSGRRSAAAAYLLSEAGYDVRILSGGFRNAERAVAA